MGWIEVKSEDAVFSNFCVSLYGNPPQILSVSNIVAVHISLTNP